jgi:hypothetical protein
MKKLLRGVIILAIILVVLIIVNVICNINGVNLDSTITGTCTAVAAMLIYEGVEKKQAAKQTEE